MTRSHVSTTAPGRIDWLHGLRGIAAFMVVFTHARYFFLGTPSWPAIDAALMPTAMGVDLFFIISGFIMTYTAVHGHYAGPLDFGIKRFARVWPAYACMTLVALPVLHGAFPHDFEGWKAVLRSLVFVPADVHAPLYFDVTLPVGWTLEFEAYFYLVFAACLALGPRLRWAALTGWLLFSGVVWPQLRGHGFHWQPRIDADYGWRYASLMANPMVLEFGYGVLIGLLYLGPVRIASSRLCWNGMFLTGACALWYAFCVPGAFHGPGDWGAAAAAIVLALAIGSKTVRVPVPALAKWLGTISYSLYLTHTVTQKLMTNLLVEFGQDTHNWGFMFLSTSVALVAAYLFHVAVERRLSDRVRDALFTLRDAVRPAQARPITSAEHP